MNAFIKLGVIEPLAQALYQQGIRFPTVIQQASIPVIFKGKDIISRSETGTGKTLAYLLPLVQRVDVKKGGTQVLIMTPTRELAKQIFDVLRPFAILMEVDVADIIGGRTEEGTAYHYWNARTSFGSYTPPQSGFIRGKNGCS